MTRKKIYFPLTRVCEWIDIEDAVIEMTKLGETQSSIARMLQINKRWIIEILREVGMIPPKKMRTPKPDHTERDKLMYIQRIYEGRTLKSIGEEHGVCGARVRTITDSIYRRNCQWWRKLYAKKFPNGVLIDPDGIGEFEDEWTVEEMYKNTFDTVFDS